MYIRDTPLTILDVSNNSEIKVLYCPDNQLTAFTLNDLFRTLPYIPEGAVGEIVITGNPGAVTVTVDALDRTGDAPLVVLTSTK